MDTAGLYMDGKYKYLGEWNKDTMHGTGKFIYASGTTYDGQWDNSEYHGTGTFSWPDGRHYEVTCIWEAVLTLIPVKFIVVSTMRSSLMTMSAVHLQSLLDK